MINCLNKFFIGSALLLTFGSVCAKTSTACPSQNFKQFLNVFSENKRIQKSFTRFPLETIIRSEVANDAGATWGNPSQWTTKKTWQSYNPTDVIFPNKKARYEDSLELVFYPQRNSNRFEVLARTMGGDSINDRYYFKKQSGCWMLYKKYSLY